MTTIEISDMVELSLTGTVLKLDERYGVPVAVVAVGPFEHTQQETIVVRVDRLRLVQKFESLTAIDPATCWAPVPTRWRYVNKGEVTVGRDGSLLPILEITDDHSLVLVPGFPGIPVDPDEMVSVLVPIPERDAARLSVEALGAHVIGRRTSTGGAA